MVEETSLLRGFTITHLLPCMADPDKNRAIAEFSDDVSPTFPYLNATVPKLIYNPAANSITLKRAGRLLTYYPQGAALAEVDGREDAEVQLHWFQDLGNDTWGRRGEITPCSERRKTLDPIDVYQLLPQFNCRVCGQATCWAFSWELLFGEGTLADCPYLAEPPYEESGRRLAGLIGD